MEDNKNAYSEVIEILKLIDDEERLEKLPMEMLALLKSKANPEYKPQISKEIPLEEQNLQPETYSIISWIATKYWGEQIFIQDEEFNNIEENNAINNIIEKQIAQQDKEINTINELESNEEIQKLNKQQEVDNTTVEEMQENTANEETQNNNLMPLVYKDLKWYQKIRLAIIKWINKLFKGKNNKTSDEGIQ